MHNFLDLEWFNLILTYSISPRTMRIAIDYGLNIEQLCAGTTDCSASKFLLSLIAVAIRDSFHRTHHRTYLPCMFVSNG